MGLFTSFSGRISRAPYWIAILSLMLASTMLGFLFFVLFLGGGAALLFVGIGLVLLLFAASIPVTVKRLHDRGKSGHFAWLIYGSSVVGAAVDPWARAAVNPPGMIISLITLAIGLWFFIELGFFRGTPGPNAFGRDPLEAPQ